MAWTPTSPDSTMSPTPEVSPPDYRRSARPHRWWLAAKCLLVSFGVWVFVLSALFQPNLAQYRSAAGISPKDQALAARHLAYWSDDAARASELAALRNSNPEWDFMGRTFLVLALANMAERQPGESARYLAVMDQIIERNA